MSMFTSLKHRLSASAVALLMANTALTLPVANAENSLPIEMEQATVAVLEAYNVDQESPEFIQGFEEASSIMQGSNNGYTTFRAANGCSYSPDRFGKFNFRPACDAHDRCYGRNSRVNRLDCDNRFLSDLRRICNNTRATNPEKDACRSVTGGYYSAVRAFGGRFYQGRGLNN